MTADPFDLANKCCVVTGASSGLGLHMAGVLAAHGARVFGISRDEAADDPGGPSITHLVADVTDTARVQTFVDEIESEAGPIMCWVNNAGFGSLGRKGRLDADDLTALLAVNTVAPGVLGDLIAGRMKDNGVSGSIINVSSVLGRTAMPVAAGYGASKAALDHLTRQQARVWGRHGIRFNAIAPGWFRTPMTEDLLDRGLEDVLKGQIPMRRLGDAKDLDGALLLLASDQSRYITGSTICIDGGFSC